jgi:type I restriction enzyme S subunit
MSLPCWLYLSIKNLEPVITRKGFGSTGQTSLDNTELGTIYVPYPPYRLMETFEEKVKPIFQQIMNNNVQNRELVQLRDWLLPMLMNGQVSILE